MTSILAGLATLWMMTRMIGYSPLAFGFGDAF
jgi:hypothetical protein